MITFLIFLLAILETAAFTVFSGWVTAWYDFYLVILCFILGFLVTTAVLIVGIYLYTLTIKMKEPFNEKYSKIHRFFMDEFLKFLCVALRIKIVLKGEELIPKDERFLIVSNHLSNFDPIVANAALVGKEISWVSKKENFKIPIAGKFMYKTNFLSMDREDVRQSLKVINKAAEYVKDDVVSMGIYPEGTRNKTQDTLLPFKNGAFKIMQKARCPLVVMTLTNTEKIHKRTPFKRTRVYIDVIKKYSFEELEGKNTNDISLEVEALMAEHLKEQKSRKA